MNLPRLVRAAPRLLAIGYAHEWAATSARAVHQVAIGILPAAILLVTTREEIYNMLWGLVFGFATLNILSLGARRFEQNKRGLNFGELLAILVVFVSVVLLGWEMLYLFHVFPIHLSPR